MVRYPLSTSITIHHRPCGCRHEVPDKAASFSAPAHSAPPPLLPVSLGLSLPCPQPSFRAMCGCLSTPTSSPSCQADASQCQPDRGTLASLFPVPTVFCPPGVSSSLRDHHNPGWARQVWGRLGATAHGSGTRLHLTRDSGRMSPIKWYGGGIRECMYVVCMRDMYDPSRFHDGPRHCRLRPRRQPRPCFCTRLQ